MLASDLQNPEYVGSANPDEKLFVEFYMHKPEDPNKSAVAGKRIYGEETPYVRIQVPGDKTTVIETPVVEEHKRRWPQKYLYFQMQNGLIGGDASIPGWRVEEWDYLTPDQVRELQYMRFSVVEQIAGASDAQVQRLGMGGVGMRDAARKALRDRMGAETREELAKKDAELAEMRERMAKLEALVMQAQQPAQPLVEPTEAPKKRGRPKKNPELAVVGNGQ